MAIAGFALKPRLAPSRRWQGLSLALALCCVSAVGAVLIATSGASITAAAAAFYDGALGSKGAILETLVQATPLIFTGLAVVIAFRAKVWNIGGEGQFFAGAMATIAVTRAFPDLPGPLLIAGVVIGAAIGGALWGFVPGVLKARFGANEVVVTVMLNYVMLYLVSYIVGGVWRDPSSFYIQTSTIPTQAWLPHLLTPGRLHLGFLLALVSAVLVSFLLRRSVLGYEISAVGANPVASRYRGISVGMVVIVVMILSGAMAGLAGGLEVAGVHHRVRLDISTGYGFAGIIVALLGQLSPSGTVLAAILFGALVNGSTAMQISAGVPVALVYAIQGLTLIFVLGASVLSRYQIRRVDPSV
jgi:general nucleoside transport system permease protein